MTREELESRIAELTSEIEAYEYEVEDHRTVISHLQNHIEKAEVEIDILSVELSKLDNQEGSE
ncbi:hypothetical protein ABE151_04250 [Bacillus paralicheniformis]|uniref:hypothetical protein n=1 Tax=Bacillus paralicheniformis TaxID=1648923 RepID=UPI0011A3613A|nr:hypothetical protein [Bacillus paralicheniformis]TWL60738.1 hypothetical protein CHCC15332_3300 [Bacillus paralicheniformis]TWN34847.1 hypothetical protein CHCC14527_0456 [Bacillus paralicheniformis]